MDEELRQKIHAKEELIDRLEAEKRQAKSQCGVNSDEYHEANVDLHEANVDLLKLEWQLAGLKVELATNALKGAREDPILQDKLNSCKDDKATAKNNLEKAQSALEALWKSKLAAQETTAARGRKRQLDVENPDRVSREFARRLLGQEVSYVVAAELLSQELPIKVPVPTGWCPLDSEPWKDFVSLACEKVEEKMAASDVCSFIERFAMAPLDINDTEDTMHGIIDSLVHPVECLLGTSRKRNKTTSSTTIGARPDFSIKDVFFIEEKHINNYAKDNVRDDPKLQLENAIPWENWPHVFGNIPCVYGAWVLGNQGSAVVHLGLLKHQRCGFEELASFNLQTESGRAYLLLALLHLTPRIHNASKDQNEVQLAWQLVHDSVLTRRLSVTVMDNRLVLRKTWSTTARSDEIHALWRVKARSALKARLDMVMSKLRAYQKMDPPLFMTMIDDKVRESETQLVAHFTPFGDPRTESYHRTHELLLTATKCILNSLEELKSCKIVHNDIRWPNIVRLLERKDHYILVDFDDASVLDDNGKCAGCVHLKNEGHAPNIDEPHGHEVDVWGVGKLLQNKSFEEKFQHLGALVCQKYCVVTIEEVKELLGRVEAMQRDEDVSQFLERICNELESEKGGHGEEVNE